MSDEQPNTDPKELVYSQRCEQWHGHGESECKANNCMGDNCVECRYGPDETVTIPKEQWERMVQTLRTIAEARWTESGDGPGASWSEATVIGAARKALEGVK